MSAHTSATLDSPIGLGLQRELSPTQRALLASQLRQPSSVAQNMSHLVQFDGRIDVDRLVEAFESVVRSSDVLRTRIPHGDRAHAVVASRPTSATSRVDLPASEAIEWAHDVATVPFDLSAGCYRSAIACHDDGTVSWVVAIHHIATDATTASLVIDRTLAAYDGIEPPVTSFYDWVEQNADGLDPSGRSARYWAEREPVERPGRLYGATTRTDGAATRLPVELPPALRGTIAERLSGDYRTISDELAWAALLATGTAIYLHRLSGATEMAIGIPVHHRRGDAADLLGPAMGVYPLDVRLVPGESHRELHRRVARSVMSVIRHADPAITAPAGYDAVVNVITEATPERHDFGLTNRWLHVGEIDPEHLMRVQLTRFGAAGESVDEPQLLLDIQSEVAPPGDVGRAADHFRSVLAALVDDPDASIGTFELCPPDEIAALATASSTPDLWTGGGSLAGRLRDRLDGDGGAAVVTDDAVISGDELWRWATALAGDIDARQEPAARIGIALGPSPEAVVAVYACILAGRSFVPLDPEQPAARRRSLVERAGVAHLITHADDVRRFRDAAAVDLPDVADDDREAYLLFTSGSTGEPKGVPITRLGLARYLDFATTSYFDDVATPVAPLFTALTFDLTITTLFAPVLRGGSLRSFGSTGPSALVQLAAAHDLNWCKATPSHLEILLPMLGPDHELATLVVGGEAFGSDLARRLLEFDPDLAIFNEYGPTEAVVGCMIHRVDPSELDRSHAVPIGRPAPGVELRVVDAAGRRAPIGAAGELLIAHPGLTPGYLADGGGARDVTGAAREPFVEVEGTRFYRSGDLVSYDEHLELTYLGRIDEQVKVGGVRLDPLEVERTLMQHPGVDRAAVRLWAPTDRAVIRRCVRCGLPDNVPGAEFDDELVCSTCHEFDRVSAVAASWFRTEDDLAADLARHAGRRTGDHDVMHLLSGGKDSTYALYRLVELGMDVYTLTLDNGYISEGAKENIRRVTAHLDVDHEFVTTPHMNEIFRDSLATFSDVCHGCYKTIYTLATNRAVELGIPAIVTGLSRGQLFETRLIPGQFTADRFDADAIDRAVVEARKRYHRAPDFVNRVLDTDVFATDDVFDELAYVDFYRYVDVELSEVLDYLAERTPWQRPIDTGRSSNCLINVAGIRTHQIERGYHNYAEPYAWDVRLGHKQRDEAIDELDDPITPGEVASMLSDVGYRPSPRSVLTAWIETADGERTPTPNELRRYLGDRLPAFAVPAAFVTLAELPVNRNGKLDTGALPAPERRHRSAVGAPVAAVTELEATIISVWESTLGIEPIGPDDDFFALGGDSLAALTMIVELGEVLGRPIHEELAFAETTVRGLAGAISGVLDDETSTPTVGVPATPSGPTRTRRDAEAPPLSTGEQSILVHQRTRPGDTLYNVGRIFTVAGTVDVERLRHAISVAAAPHESLTWTYGTPRRRVDPAHVVDFVVGERLLGDDDLAAALHELHRTPIDLEHGPLLRCGVLARTDGRVDVAFVLHHVSGDLASLDTLWDDVDRVYRGDEAVAQPYGLADFCAWQETTWERAEEFWRQQRPFADAPDFGAANEPGDGMLTRVASVTAGELRSLASRTPVSTVLGAAASVVSPFFRGAAEVALLASTRDHTDAGRLFGYLLNPVPLTVDVDAMATIDEVADEMSRLVGRVLPHRSYPFARVVSDARRRGGTPPTGSILVSYADDPRASLDGRPADIRMLWNGHSVADATFFVEPRTERVDLAIEFSGAAMDRATAGRLLDAFDDALTAAVRHSGRSVAEVTAGIVAALPGPGSPSVLDGGPLDDRELLPVKTWRFFESDAPAVEAADGALAWPQLAARTGQIAAALSRHGVSRGDRVAVRLSRSVNVPAAILGVHAVGASYVPIDPAYPIDRSRSSIEQAGAEWELSSSTIEPLAPNRLVVDDQTLDGSPWDDGHPAPAVPAIDPDDEAYLIFTSGSTGVPDGVSVTHGQLAASTNARAAFYDEAPTRFLVPSSIAFDSSLVGLFWTLSTGGAVILPGDGVVHDIDALLGLIDSSRPSHLLCVPTLYGGLLSRKPADARWPAHVIVAGEACLPGLVAEHVALVPASTLTNEYGPTEATVWATAHRCRPGESVVPIGRPVAGTWVAVVDADRVAVPVGTDGELAIGGLGVANGYVGTDDGRRFVDAAELRGVGERHGRVFLTGDRASVVGDELLFHGRVDDQLNVGGARVEPGDVEAVIETNPAVIDAVVVAVDPRPIDRILADLPPATVAAVAEEAATSDDPADHLVSHLRRLGPRPRLVAHLVASDDLDVAALRRAVADALPVTHRPTVYQRHDRLPQLPNGKVDRAAVATLAIDVDRGSPAPATSTVGEVSGLMREVLLVDEVSAEGSFFDLGGNSLLALELITRLEQRYGISLPLGIVHEEQTAAGLAERIASLLDGDPSAASDEDVLVYDLRSGGTGAPVFVLHNLGVNADKWRDLVAHLDSEHPWTALGDPKGIFNPYLTEYDLERDVDIGAAGAMYARVIDARHPTGPVVLIGACVGGVVALDVAQRLAALGREVDNVITINDWHAPELVYENTLRHQIEAAWRHRRGSVVTYVVARLPVLVRLVRSRGRRMAERLLLAGFGATGLPLPRRLQVRQKLEEDRGAAHRYTIAPYSGRVTVIRGADDPKLPPGTGRRGWGDLFTQLAVWYSHGEGPRLFREPWVRDTAAVVDAVLRGEGDYRPSADVSPPDDAPS